MIRVETITIVEFRGIRNMTLDFKGKNFAICGPNGTGKSGIVDALEFVLTGNISRLSGEGSGDISVKKHAPHVDKINDPGKSFVRVTLTIPHLDRSVTIERSPLNPTLKNVSPGEPEILKVLEIIAEHPEIKLSRREIIRYVLATPGKRADEVQALLHLEKVSQVRAGLQKIANTCEKDLSTCVTISKNSGEALMRALNSSDFTREQILAAANAQRTILGLAPIAELTATTSLKDGMAT
ncbi:MAG: ATP-binding protein, partial [Chthoniobacterales bacterium]